MLRDQRNRESLQNTVSKRREDSEATPLLNLSVHNGSTLSRTRWIEPMPKSHVEQPELLARFLERSHQSAFGRYKEQIEKSAILRAHRLAATTGNALEIGCGTGRWSKMLSDLGWTMTCTDVNEWVLESCKGKVPTAKCILVRPEDSRLPCDSGSMGLIVCMEVVSVIKSPWFPEESARVLCSGGLMVGVFLNLLSYSGAIAHFTASLRRTYDYYDTPYALFKRRMERKGFTFLHQNGMCWFPFRITSNSRFIPAFTRIEKTLALGKLPHVSPWIVFVAQKLQ